MDDRNERIREVLSGVWGRFGDEEFFGPRRETEAVQRPQSDMYAGGRARVDEGSMRAFSEFVESAETPLTPILPSPFRVKTPGFCNRRVIERSEPAAGWADCLRRILSAVWERAGGSEFMEPTEELQDLEALQWEMQVAGYPSVENSAYDEEKCNAWKAENATWNKFEWGTAKEVGMT